MAAGPDVRSAGVLMPAKLNLAHLHGATRPSRRGAPPSKLPRPQRPRQTRSGWRPAPRRGCACGTAGMAVRCRSGVSAWGMAGGMQAARPLLGHAPKAGQGATPRNARAAAAPSLPLAMAAAPPIPQGSAPMTKTNHQSRQATPKTLDATPSLQVDCFMRFNFL